MFPTPGDISAHKRAQTREKNELIELSRRAGEIGAPDELVDFILEICTKKYRRGERTMKFSVDIPTENFIPWATVAKIGSKDWDRLDRMALKHEITRIARVALRRQVASGVFLKLESGCITDMRLSFIVTLSVIRPS